MEETQKVVTIVQTGIANTSSVVACLRRLELTPIIADNSLAVERSDFVILPGVGAFGAGISKLQESGLNEALLKRWAQNKPTLAICLGMQLLSMQSEESPGFAGLSIAQARTVRFNNTKRVPQLGWNEVIPQEGCRFLERGFAYFANSYHLDSIPEGWAGAIADYEGSFVAAIERGNWLACQFHPELSGSWGSNLVKRWLTETDYHQKQE